MTHDHWIGPLVMAALPGAVRVVFAWTETADGVSYALRSFDGNNQQIGDARDYELLSMVMRPLEACAGREGFAAKGKTRTATLVLETRAVTLS